MNNKSPSDYNEYLINDEECVKHTVSSYLKQLSHAQIHLKQPHLEHICDKNMCMYVYLRYKQLLRRMKAFHCKIEYYKIEPQYFSITFDENISNVKVISRERLKFVNVNNETLRNNTHVLTLIKYKNKWIISSDKDDETDSRLLYRFDNEQNIKYESSLQIQHDFFNKLLKLKELRDIFPKSSENESKLNREKMKQYQISYWNKRPHQWGNFDDMGGDCTNYASQVVYAGGVPMINNSKYQWYYYGYNNRAPSWTGVEQFHDFLAKNKSDSIVGIELPSNIGLMTGDIIQVDLDGDGIFNHTSVVYEPLGYMGILPTITSHTLDRFNEPVLTFNFTDIRWIHLV